MKKLLSIAMLLSLSALVAMEQIEGPPGFEPSDSKEFLSDSSEEFLSDNGDTAKPNNLAVTKAAAIMLKERNPEYDVTLDQEADGSYAVKMAPPFPWIKVAKITALTGAALGGTLALLRYLTDKDKK